MTTRLSVTATRSDPETQPAPRRPAGSADGQVVLVLTFDLDAETHLVAQDPSNLARASVLSAARYGVGRGLERVLALLAEERVRATFFIPGSVIEAERGACEAIVRHGHEVAHHGYTHLSPLACSPEEEREELRRGIDAIARLTGRPPAGYRAPYREVSPKTLDLLVEHGFVYASNMMDDDRPYRPRGGSGTLDLVELPVNPLLDDASFFLYRPPQQRHVFPAEQALAVWREELSALTEEPGACLVMTLHPELIGRASRVAALRAFIRLARRHRRLRFMTAHEAAEAYLRGEL